MGKLPDKRQQREIGKRWPFPEQPHPACQLPVETGQIGGCFRAFSLRIQIRVTCCIFRVIQRSFERAIIGCDEVPAVFGHIQKPLRVVLSECPDHDIEAFIQHLIVHPKCRHRS